MTTDFDQFLRVVYKEFHAGGNYYKGKGREMLEWILRKISRSDFSFDPWSTL